MSGNLDAIADAAGRFAILAMDQRGTLRRMLASAGQPAADDDLSTFKVQVVSQLSPLASAVLLDAEYGAQPVLQSGALARGVGLLVSSERSPGQAWQGEPRAHFDPSRGPQFVAAAGGVALKFLVRWTPDRPVVAGEPDLAGEAIAAVRDAIAACRSAGMPAVIEPLVVFPGRTGEVPPATRQQLIVRSAELMAQLSPDLLKLEWPGSGAGCSKLTAACGAVPWTLLSAGVAFDPFVEQVRAAMDAGATGFIAGRAIWGEAVRLTPDERVRFLRETAAPRLSILRQAIAGRGRSWQEVAAA